ncbi:MAG: response regulator [Pseudomonadota bacterium]
MSVKHHASAIAAVGLPDPQLIAQLERAGIVTLVVAPERAADFIAEAMRNDTAPPLTLLVRLERPLAMARQLRALYPQGQLLLLCEADAVAGVRRELGRTPMMGKGVSVLGISDPGLVAEIGKTVQAVRLRQRLRTTIARANAVLAAPKSPADLRLQQLVTAERYLGSLLEQASDAIVGLDPQQRVAYWNAASSRLLRLPLKDARGRAARDLPLWSAALDAALADAPAQKERTVLEVRPAVLAGVVLEITLSAIRDDGGALLGTMLLVRDVSDRHLLLDAERARNTAAITVAQSRYHQMATLFDQAPGFMAVTRGREHVYELANQAYLNTLGVRPLLGNAMDAAFPELEGQPFQHFRDQVFISGQPFIGKDMPVLLRRGAHGALEQRYLDFVYQPLFDDAGAIWGIFCQGNDVTEQKLMHDLLVEHQGELERLVDERTAELQKTQSALHHAQKLEAIGKLTGGIAHDFNNILQVIGANLDLLGQEHAATAGAPGRIASAQRAVERGAKLTAQLLAFARRQPLKPAPLNLGRIMRELDDLLRRALGESVEIETVIGGGLWTTLVDRTQLENVVLNLAINARDAMRGGGRLTIEIGNAMLDQHYVSANEEVRAGQYVMLAISDTGHGMNADVLERAIEPFFTTKGEGDGTGLGLSMAYGVVKQSGGHLKIYSEVDQGTTIKIYLPRSELAEIVEQSPRRTRVSGGTETILVVEDDADVRALVVDQLVGLGYTVLRASNAQTALSVLQSGARVDLLFTDVVMPGTLRSPELARLARDILPDIAVLFTSGYTQNAIVHAGRLDPGVELLSKPYGRQQLAAHIRAVLDQRAAHRVPDAGAGLRILVVEDNEDARDMLCQMLTMFGHQPQCVGSAEAALPLLGAADLLLTDVRLPAMSGIELARLALQSHPALRIVFISGAHVPTLEFPAVVLQKPYAIEQLQAALSG